MEKLEYLAVYCRTSERRGEGEAGGLFGKKISTHTHGILTG